jgi:hypothetical protein
MSIPEITSAEAFERYVGGKCLTVGHGEAWREIKAWIVALPPVVDTLHLPSVSEPFLVWTMSVRSIFRNGKTGGLGSLIESRMDLFFSRQEASSKTPSLQ